MSGGLVVTGAHSLVVLGLARVLATCLCMDGQHAVVRELAFLWTVLLINSRQLTDGKSGGTVTLNRGQSLGSQLYTI